FNPPSLLTQLGFFGLRRLADRLGLPVETLTIIQTVNALAAGIGAAVIYGLIARARARGDWTWRLVAGVALLNSLAVLLRQENVLFGLAAVALLTVGRPWRPAVRDALVYGAVGSVGTWTAAVVVGLLGA